MVKGFFEGPPIGSISRCTEANSKTGNLQVDAKAQVIVPTNGMESCYFVNCKLILSC